MLHIFYTPAEHFLEVYRLSAAQHKSSHQKHPACGIINPTPSLRIHHRPYLASLCTNASVHHGKQLSLPYSFWSFSSAVATLSPAESCLPVVHKLWSDSQPQTQQDRTSVCVCVNEYWAATVFSDRHHSPSLTPIP